MCAGTRAAPRRMDGRTTEVRLVSIKQQQDITRFFEHVQGTARNAFKRDGVCVPAAILLLEDKQVVLPLNILGQNKDVASMLLKKLIEKTRPLAFVLVTEAWMASGRKSDLKGGNEQDIVEKYNGTLVERTPDGGEKPKDGVKEVVILNCSSVTGENFTLMADIIRKPGRKPILKPWERFDNRDARGRFIFDVTPLIERQ